MEDILIMIITAAVMIGGAINAAYKKKKEAAQKTSSHPDSEQDKELRHKSLSEILQELEEKTGEPEWLSEQEQEAESELEYYSMGADSLEERAMAEVRLEAVTYRPIEKNQSVFASRMAGSAIGTSHIGEVAEAAEIESAQSIAAQEKEPETLNDILGGGFNLKRAIIESEILKPKYELY